MTFYGARILGRWQRTSVSGDSPSSVPTPFAALRRYLYYVLVGKGQCWGCWSVTYRSSPPSCFFASAAVSRPPSSERGDPTRGRHVPERRRNRPSSLASHPPAEIVMGRAPRWPGASVHGLPLSACWVVPAPQQATPQFSLVAMLASPNVAWGTRRSMPLDGACSASRVKV